MGEGRVEEWKAARRPAPPPALPARQGQSGGWVRAGRVGWGSVWVGGKWAGQ